MARIQPIVVKTTVVLKLNSLVRPRHQRGFKGHVIREDLKGFGPCCSWAAGGGRLGCGQVNKLQVSLPSCGDRKPPRARAAFRVDPVASGRCHRIKWLAKQCTGRVFDARSEACIHTLPRVGRQIDHLAAPVLGRSGCPCVWTVRSRGAA